MDRTIGHSVIVMELTKMGITCQTTGFDQIKANKSKKGKRIKYIISYYHYFISVAPEGF